MDKLFVTKKQEKLKAELQETKAKMKELFEKIFHSFDTDSYEHKVINRLYDSFKKEEHYLCAIGLHLITFHGNITEEDKANVNALYELIDKNSNIFAINPNNYYDELLDGEPVEFNGDIVITDPCYIMKEDTNDWAECNIGYELNKLGFSTFMTRDTLYGDWSCTAFNTDTKEKIGCFCADAGMVTVALLEDIKKYNPDFEEEYLIKRNHCATVIRNFKGTINFVVKRETFKYKGEQHEDFYLEIVGKGINSITGKDINFVTKQTGL